MVLLLLLKKTFHWLIIRSNQADLTVLASLNDQLGINSVLGLFSVTISSCSIPCMYLLKYQRLCIYKYLKSILFDKLNLSCKNTWCIRPFQHGSQDGIIKQGVLCNTGRAKILTWRYPRILHLPVSGQLVNKLQQKFSEQKLIFFSTS